MCSCVRQTNQPLFGRFCVRVVIRRRIVWLRPYEKVARFSICRLLFYFVVLVVGVVVMAARITVRNILNSMASIHDWLFDIMRRSPFLKY